jgi:phage baseplate assembly protein W
MPLLNQPKYTDLPVFLTKNRYTNDFNLVKDKNTIRAAIKNILLTLNGERPFANDFGTALYDTLFEKNEYFLIKGNHTSGKFIKNKILNTIYSSIALYEPRVDPQSLQVTVKSDDKNPQKIHVTIDTTIISSDETITIVITL